MFMNGAKKSEDGLFYISVVKIKRHSEINEKAFKEYPKSLIMLQSSFEQL